MLLIPYRVDVPFDRRPFVNWILIGSVVFVSMLQIYWVFQRPLIPEDITESQEIVAVFGPLSPYVLDGWTARGLLGHMWLHGGFFHLFGNMLFLWIFGNAVCQKLGNGMYLPLYLLMGFIAAVMHLIFNSGAAIGASGAINGVVGMFLVFFPLNDMQLLFTFFPFLPLTLGIRAGFRTCTISSFWMILVWLGFDIFGAVKGGQGVGYFAHLGGFFSGVIIAIVLLKLKAVTMERDELSLLQILGGQRWSDVHQPKGPGEEDSFVNPDRILAGDSRGYQKFLEFQKKIVDQESESQKD